MNYYDAKWSWLVLSLVTMTLFSFLGVFSIANAQGDPTPPVNLSVTSNNPTSLSFSWSPGSNTVYYLVAFQQGSIPRSCGTVAGSFATTYSVGDLTPNTQYTIAVCAANQAQDRSNPATLTVVTGVNTPPPSPCTLNGQTIASGQSTTAYQSSSVAFGQMCVSEQRTCTNGTLSGSYTNSACTVGAPPPLSCTFNGQTIVSGQSTTAYQSSSVAFGQMCVSEQRACTNGVLSGSYTNGACTVAAAQNNITATLSINPANITSGNSSTLTWSSTNATSCIGTGFTANGTSGSVTVSPTATTNYAISCSGPPANANATLTVTAATPPPGVNATVTLQANPSGKLLDSTFAGLSFEKDELSTNLFRGDNTNLINLFKKIGPSVLRIGANAVDFTTWTPTGAGHVSRQIAPSDVDRFAAFVHATGWKVIYGVNLAHVDTNYNPALAGAEASYANTALGSSLLGFEIGNEPDLYVYFGGRPANWVYADFKAEWEAYAASIRAAVPGAVLTGPAVTNNPLPFPQFLAPFASDEKTIISLLTQHYYRGASSDPASTIDFLLTPDPALPALLQGAQTAATQNNIPLGYRFDEVNTLYGGGRSGVSDGFGTALWLIDYLFTHAQYNSNGVDFHGGEDSPYEPISNDAAIGVVTVVRPEYYGMFAFSQIANGRLMHATTNAGGLNFSSYAVAENDGSYGIILSNKDRTNAVVAVVTLPGTVTQASSLLLTAPSLDSTTGYTYGGAAIGNDASWTPTSNPAVPFSGNTITVSVPAGSAQIVKVNSTPTPPPPPPPAFAINDRVQTTDNISVRATPNGTLLETQVSGALGTVVGGPATAGGLTWWQVKYDNSIIAGFECAPAQQCTSGWTIEDFLIKYVATPPPPTPFVIPFGTTINDSQNMGGTGDYLKFAMQFTPTSSATSLVPMFSVFSVGSPTDNLVVSIVSDESGFPSNVVLGSSQLSHSALSSTCGTSSTFPGINVNLAANTKYWVVLSRSGALSNTNRYELCAQDGQHNNDKQYDGSTWRPVNWGTVVGELHAH